MVPLENKLFGHLDVYVFRVRQFFSLLQVQRARTLVIFAPLLALSLLWYFHPGFLNVKAGLFVLVFCMSLGSVFVLPFFFKPLASFYRKFLRFFLTVIGVPIVLLTAFAIVFLYFGVQAWFNQKVQTALSESRITAQAYLKEHQENLKYHVRAFKNDFEQSFKEALQRSPHNIKNFAPILNHFLTLQTNIRKLDECIIFSGRGDVIARSQFAFGLEFESIARKSFEKAQNSVLIFPNKRQTRFLGIAKLPYGDDLYLIAARKVDPKILKRIAMMDQAYAAYHKILEDRHAYISWFILLFLGVMILILGGAVWRGFTFADMISRPLQHLIEAAQKIQKGLYSTRCLSDSRPKRLEEINDLITVFNQMAEEVEEQQKALSAVHQELKRRHFLTKNVLKAVSSGVVALDEKGVIVMANARASELLKVGKKNLVGRSLSTVCPELWECFQNIHDQEFVDILIQGTNPRTFRVHVQGLQNRSAVTLQPVITFDDITLFLIAQRQAAWADIGRRVAHEVKNPLTPIQLSAERLKRRYLPQINKDPDIFESCIETIQRQVKHLSKLLEEFLSFARLPAPQKTEVHLKTLVKEALELQKAAFPEILWRLEGDDLNLECDPGQIGQALTNLFKNSMESIQSKGINGEVRVNIFETADEILLSMTDNGVGLPKGLEKKVMDPYVTTKNEGNGLGLAVVQRIVHDHNGVLSLVNRPEGGVVTRLAFRKKNGKPLDFYH